VNTVSQLLEPWYITGVVEGAGSFTFSRTDRNIVPYFALRLASDERGMLEDIQAYFGGLGRIYAIAAGHSLHEGAGSARRPRYYRVTRIDDLDLVIQHFDDYPLRGPKAAAYAVWRELVTLKRTAYRRPDRERLDQLCKDLSAVSPRTRTPRESDK
jgi:hypothetical protein